MGDEAKKDPPPGSKPIFIQMRNTEKYGLKTGPAMTDVLPYKFFSRKAILEEIQGLGVYCDFQPFTKEIEAYPEEEFLLLGDPGQVYGDAWLLVYQVETKESLLKAIQDKIDAEETAARAIKEEEARVKAEEEARLCAVFEDKPIVPQPYASATSQETQAEVLQLTVRSKRELYGMTVTRPRSSFRKPYTFADRDTSFDGAVEFRSHKDPAFDLVRKEADIGLQAAPTALTLSTQTTWYRAVNKAVQFQSHAANTHNKDTNPKPVTRDAETSPDKYGSNLNNKASLTPEQALTDFLRRVRPQMEDALQQNESVNIFQDAFKMLGDEDSHMAKKGENELKELRAFSSLLYSKNKALAAIDWHPKKKGMVAVAPTRNLNFNQKMDIDGMVSTAYILVWDFVDFSSPQFLLQSPQEVYTFRFNTTRPNVIVAGSLTGQLLLWDITHALHLVAKQRNRGQRAGHSSGNPEDDEDDDKVIPPVLPDAISHIDTSHKRPVSEVVWLPPSIQVNFRGQVLAEEYSDGTSYQLLSIAGDGQVLIWDTRYEQIAEGQLPHIAKPRTQDKGGKDQHIKHPWAPLFRLQLKRPEGVGELSLCRVHIAYAYPDATGPTGEDESLKSKLYLATEEGDFLSADWRAKQNKEAGAKDGDEGGAEERGPNETNYVEWMKVDHPRPCVSLQKSPFFSDMYMTVGDWNFRLWKVDNETPIFTSPNASTYITVGRWSVTRPGLLLIAKVDGSLDVWDFTDTSHRPSVTLMCGPSRITSMEFLRPAMNSSKQQLLAVGDANGNLHIFDLPRNLWKPLPNEKATIRHFLDRELKKMDYVAMRMDYRREEAENKAKELEAAAQASVPAPGDTKGAKKDGATQAAAAAGGPSGEGEDRSPPEADDPEVTAMQALYTDLEAKFIQDLGLTAEDLPPGYTLPKAEEAGKGGRKK